MSLFNVEIFLFNEAQIVSFIVVLGPGASTEFSGFIISAVSIWIVIIIILLYLSALTYVCVDSEAFLSLIIVPVSWIHVRWVAKGVLLKLLSVDAL